MKPPLTKVSCLTYIGKEFTSFGWGLKTEKQLEKWVKVRLAKYAGMFCYEVVVPI